MDGYFVTTHNHSGCIHNSSHSPYGTGKAWLVLSILLIARGSPLPSLSRKQAGVAVTENGRENLDFALAY